eukprot:g6858.t1
MCISLLYLCRWQQERRRFLEQVIQKALPLPQDEQSWLQSAFDVLFGAKGSGGQQQHPMKVLFARNNLHSLKIDLWQLALRDDDEEQSVDAALRLLVAEAVRIGARAGGRSSEKTGPRTFSMLESSESRAGIRSCTKIGEANLVNLVQTRGELRKALLQSPSRNLDLPDESVAGSEAIGLFFAHLVAACQNKALNFNAAEEAALSGTPSAAADPFSELNRTGATIWSPASYASADSPSAPPGGPGMSMLPPPPPPTGGSPGGAGAGIFPTHVVLASEACFPLGEEIDWDEPPPTVRSEADEEEEWTPRSCTGRAKRLRVRASNSGVREEGAAVVVTVPDAVPSAGAATVPSAAAPPAAADDAGTGGAVEDAAGPPAPTSSDPATPSYMSAAGNLLWGAFALGRSTPEQQRPTPESQEPTAPDPSASSLVDFLPSVMLHFQSDESDAETVGDGRIEEGGGEVPGRREASCNFDAVDNRMLEIFMRNYGDTRAILQQAFFSCAQLGSTTALLMVLDKDVLFPCNCGDCGYRILRLCEDAGEDAAEGEGEPDVAATTCSKTSTTTATGSDHNNGEAPVSECQNQMSGADPVPQATPSTSSTGDAASSSADEAEQPHRTPSLAQLVAVLPDSTVSVGGNRSDHTDEAEPPVAEPVRPTTQYRIISRSTSQLHAFNTPFQLTRMPDFDYDSVEARWAMMRRVANEEPVRVRPGDVVISGSDGFFDNVFDERLELLVNEFLLPLHADADADAGDIAESRWTPGDDAPTIGGPEEGRSATPPWGSAGPAGTTRLTPAKSLFTSAARNPNNESPPVEYSDSVSHMQAVMGRGNASPRPRKSPSLDPSRLEAARKLLCDRVFEEAIRNGVPGTDIETPFSRACNDQIPGRSMSGGKPDDITVVVSVVTKTADSGSSAVFAAGLEHLWA